MPVVQHLLRFAIALALPIVILVGLGLWRYAEQDAARYTDEVRGIARDLARDLDRELLALSAGLVAAPMEGTDPAPTVADAGKPPAAAGTEATAALARAAISSDRFVVSDLYIVGADDTRPDAGGEPRVAIAAPRRQGGAVTGVALQELPAEHFRTLILAGEIPPGWAAAIVDRNGTIVARRTRHEELVGRPATPTFRAAASGDSGNWQGISQDGQFIIGGFARSAVSGWYVATGVPKHVVFAPLRQSLLLLGGFVLAVLALAGSLAVIFGRRIAQPISALADAARQLETSTFAGLPPTRVSEVNQVAQALAFAQARIAEHEAERVRLRETEERLRLAQQAANIGIHDYDVASGSIRWDARTRQLWSVGPDLPITYALFQASLHPEDRAAVEAAVAAALDPAGNGDYGIEYRIIGFNDGVERWISATGQVQFDGGRPVRLVGTVADISERKAAAEREILLAREVEHRARNVLAVALSLIRQTPFHSHRQFVQTLSGRLAALDRVQRLLSRAHWRQAGLQAILDDELAAYSDRVTLAGPPVALSAADSQSFALVIHELATNAVKYGALSVDSGRLAISWTIAADRSLRLVWQEQASDCRVEEPGDPGRVPAATGGFGAKLIDITIGTQLRGSIHRQWRAEGLIVIIILPGKEAVREEGPEEASATDAYAADGTGR